MSGPRLDNERLALIIVEAMFFGDERTADRWSITPRTIYNYRKRLHNNSELSELFINKKREFESEWANDVPATIRMAMDYIRRATQELSVTPEGLHAVTGAFKIVSEIGIAKEVMDAKLRELGYYTGQGERDGAIVEYAALSEPGQET